MFPVPVRTAQGCDCVSVSVGVGVIVCLHPTSVFSVMLIIDSCVYCVGGCATVYLYCTVILFIDTCMFESSETERRLERLWRISE